MKKAIFSTEISLLRRTMQRLLRRNAHSNITKILRKTHQADVAHIMRTFNQFEQKTIFSLCPTALHKARLLEELDEALIENVLIKENSPKSKTSPKIRQICCKLQNNQSNWINCR